MKINASAISMSSSRSYQKTSYTNMTVVRMTQQANLSNAVGKKDLEPAATISLSEKSKTMLQQFKQLKKEQREKMKTGGVSKNQQEKAISSEDELKLQTLKRLLEALKRMREGKKLYSRLDLPQWQQPNAHQERFNFDNTETPDQNVSIWTRQISVSSFVEESENTSFSAMGMVTTEDGREIGFNVSVEMSRSYMEQNSYLKNQTVIVTDPLVINLKGDVASVSDQKFLFDLDVDGEEDEISYLNQGSGFLALDKNSDGIINDGSELFGTQSGDGFKDLSVYDEDQNGWIDENDSVFQKLKIWTKQADGSDRLIGIGEAGVGAIYLESAATKFSLNQQETNESNAIICSTGVFLKENGGVGTVQHVDLVL